jgi:16S rRNA (cytosine1402-N4)-methyltransferase
MEKPLHGAGGHAKKIIEAGGRVLGIDFDKEAIRQAAKRFSVSLDEENGYLFGKSKDLILAQGNFADLGEIVKKFGVWETPGILFDLGISSEQLEKRKLGLSFLRDEPLDMRLDQSLSVKAVDLVNGLSLGELDGLFNKFGEEFGSRRIARAICQARVEKRIETTGQLAKIVSSVVPRRGKTHPATKVFQALRIAVNDELGNLRKGLEQAVSVLEKDGRLVVISFHSLEDRIVKSFFKESKDLKNLTKKPISPAREEVLENPRSRSAKLRVAVKN